MTTVRVLGLKDGTTAEDHRLGLSVFMAGAGAAALDRRSGVVPYVGSCDLTAVSAMVGRVSAFAAWVDGTTNSLQGGYPVVVDGNTDLTFANGEAGNTRIDRVVLQIRDNPYDASGFQDGRVVIVQGQAGGAANAIPASSLLLWEVLVPTGANAGNGGITFSSARTDKRTYTSALNGLVRVDTATERDLMTPYESLQVWRVDAKGRQVYTGSAWRWMDTIVCTSASNRDTLVPSGERYTGQQVYRSDKGWTEMYTGSVWAPIGLPTLFARKTADESISNTTLQNDDHLFLAVEANRIYQISGLLLAGGDPAGDIKIGWTGPAAATLTWVATGQPAAGTTASGSVQTDAKTISDTVNLATIVGSNLTAVLTGLLVVGANAGTLQLQFAEVSATGTSIMRTNSHIAARLVA